MHLKKTYATAGEAKRASKPKQKIRAGWQRNPAKIKEAFERPDKNGEPMIELLLDLPLPDGGEFERRDWLSNEWAPEKLRNCCIACGLLDHYEQQDIPAELFLGKAVMVKLGFSGKFLNIEDYRAVPALANLRNVAKALLLLGGVSLAALTGACANVDPFNPYPHGQSTYVEPTRYQYYEPRVVDPPANYAATVAPQSSPVALSSPSWSHDLGTLANGAAIGAAGGMIAGRAMERREAAQVAGRALAGEAGAVAGGATAARAGAVGVEALTAGRAVGAARAGALLLEAEGLIARGLLAEWWWVPLLLF
jgi:hypothetical protein